MSDDETWPTEEELDRLTNDLDEAQRCIRHVAAMLGLTAKATPEQREESGVDFDDAGTLRNVRQWVDDHLHRRSMRKLRASVDAGHMVLEHEPLQQLESRVDQHVMDAVGELFAPGNPVMTVGEIRERFASAVVVELQTMGYVTGDGTPR